MEYFHAISLVFLEMTFLFVGLALLYNQRNAIGQTPFHIALGVLLLFSHLVAAADIRATLAEVVDFRAEFAAKDAQSQQVIDFLEQITPEQYVRKLADSNRRVKVQ